MVVFDVWWSKLCQIYKIFQKSDTSARSFCESAHGAKFKNDKYAKYNIIIVYKEELKTNRLVVVWWWFGGSFQRLVVKIAITVEFSKKNASTPHFNIFKIFFRSSIQNRLVVFGSLLRNQNY